MPTEPSPASDDALVHPDRAYADALASTTGEAPADFVFRDAAAAIHRVLAQLKQLRAALNAQATSYSAQLAERDARIARKDEALRQCEIQFRQYEKLHLAKRTQDGDEKAFRNRHRADIASAALKDTTP